MSTSEVKNVKYNLPIIILIFSIHVNGQKNNTIQKNTKNTDHHFEVDVSCFRDCSIIGLGEVSHGSKTINDYRTRLTIELIKKYPVRYILWEEAFGVLESVNHLLEKDKPDFNAIVRHFTWFWQTEETIALLKFIHQYNKNNPATKVKIYGMDYASNWTSYQQIKKVLSPYKAFEEILKNFSIHEKSFKKYKRTTKKQVSQLRHISSLLADELYSNKDVQNDLSEEVLRITHQHISNLYKYPEYDHKKIPVRDKCYVFEYFIF